VAARVTQTRGTTNERRWKGEQSNREWRTGAFLGHDQEGNRHIIFKQGGHLSHTNGECMTCGQLVEYVPGTMIRSVRSCTGPTGHHWPIRVTSLHRLLTARVT
jgi:hypothetical protein